MIQISFHLKHPMINAYAICPSVNDATTKTKHPQLRLSVIGVVALSSPSTAQSIAPARVLPELTPPEIWYKTAHRQTLKELRVRTMALVQSSGEQRSSMQRREWGCPTFKTHLVPHWRESRCSVGGGGNQPTKQLFWQRMLCGWKYGKILLWVEEWYIHWSTVIINQFVSPQTRSFQMKRDNWCKKGGCGGVCKSCT